MKANIFIRLSQHLAAGLLMVFFLGCEREIEDLELATYSSNPEVFIDGFSPGLNYAAFGGSVPTAFDVDNSVTWNNSAASMRFEVPNANDPRGSFAGGVFYSEFPRDLSGFNALTFWAKASQAATIGEIGFGNDLGENKYVVSISGLTLSTGWKKYIIPIPDPSRLTAERGMFWLAAGNIDGNGFTFWVDEVKFEKLGTIAHPKFAILNGEDQVETSFIGISKVISGLRSEFNMPTGVYQAISIAPAYFDFQSSDPSIATIDENGRITVTGGPGNTTIRAHVGDVEAEGSLTIQSIGEFENAPIPTHDPESVISIFSDHYENVPVDYYNGYWEPWQTTVSADFEVNGDHILHYLDFNFVGIQFANPTVDASSMTHLHLNIYLPNPLNDNAQFQVELVDFGADVAGAMTTTISVNEAQQWLTLELPLSGFSGLTSRSNLAQIIFVDVNGNIPSFYADNIYFFDDGGDPPPPPPPPDYIPTEPAPTPTHAPGNVISIYSDHYSNVPVDYFNGFWEPWQTTGSAEFDIDGDNILYYFDFNFVGIEFANPTVDATSMTHLHVHIYLPNPLSSNAQFQVELVDFGADVAGALATTITAGQSQQWISLSLPLDNFSGLTSRANLAQIIFVDVDGNIPSFFADNIYFYSN